MNIHIENASYEISEMFSSIKDIAHYPNYPHSATFTTTNDEEFLWVEDNEEAEKQTKLQMQDLFDDIGITAWNQDFIESIVPDDFVDFVDPAFKAVMENNDYTLSRSNAWLPFLDEIFEESIKSDGVAHTLSGYDGEEIELKHGLAYRLN